MLSTSLASVMRRSMTASASYSPSEKMCTVQHQSYIPRGTEAIPRVCCSRLQGSEQKERWGDLARLRHRLVLESGYIHREEAPPIDV